MKLSLFVLLTIFGQIVLGVPHFLPKPRLEDQENRIVGGFQVTIEDAPYQAALTSYYFQFCGGSIISSSWILTASHCVEGSNVDALRIRVGSEKHATAGYLLGVKSVVMHPQYDPISLDYDFALIELASNIPNEGPQKALELPEQDENVDDGTLGLVTGWGHTKDPNESSDILRGVIVPTVNQNLCNEAYYVYGGVTPRMVCAGYMEEGGKDSCQGDSGGPLSVDGKLIGVVSWGAGCAQPKYPGVYARVSTVRNWIKSVSGV